MVNWDAIGAVGEVVGALAVVITLIYLARQTQENTKSTNNAAAGAYMQSYSAAWGRFSEPANAHIVRVGLVDDGDLTPDEAVSFEFLIATFWSLWESLFMQYQNGAIPEEHWLVARSDIVWMSDASRVRDLFERALPSYEATYPEFAKEFRRCMDEKPLFTVVGQGR